MRNANRAPEIPYSAVVTGVEKWLGIRIRDQITITSSQCFRLVGPIVTPSFNEVGWLV